MNIFVLDEDPIAAARMHCDRHVIKMVLESAQILCTVLHDAGVGGLKYKPTHQRHPCTLWAARSKANFRWLVQLSQELGEEHMRRYVPARPHASLAVIDACAKLERAYHTLLPDGGLTEFVQCMPDQFRRPPGQAVEAYRAYYRTDKQRFATWRSPRKAPDWY